MRNIHKYTLAIAAFFTGLLVSYLACGYIAGKAMDKIVITSYSNSLLTCFQLHDGKADKIVQDFESGIDNIIKSGNSLPPSSEISSLMTSIKIYVAKYGVKITQESQDIISRH